jgi:acetylornithine deacetylase/succinyl-diaminopimelate desuccinylase-like protein
MLSDRVLDLACVIQQIPAPTFAEAQRAAFMQTCFTAAGLSDVRVDALGNVFGRRLGSSQGRPVLVTAHTDTVFPSETDLTLTRTASTINGPGIGDNSLGVAGLLGLVWALDNEPLAGDLWLAANVGEEGLGDLRGMRAVVEALGDHVANTIVIEGMALGHIYHGGIGVRRYRIAASAEGGHSWLNFGRPSAVHTLVRLAAALADLPVPGRPKTTYNIGTIAGGTTVNTIAREAELVLDLRSEDPMALDQLERRVLALVHHHHAAGIRLVADKIGDRPSGSIPANHPLVRQATHALQQAGVQAVLDYGSTDANIPLSQGRPCVCIGLTTGGNAHRPDEFIETAPLERGLAALVSLVRGAAQAV